MRARDSKSWARLPHLELSKASQGKVLDDVAQISAEPQSSYQKQLVGRDLAQDATALQPSRKRQHVGIKASANIDTVPVKRARLTQPVAQRDSRPCRRSARLSQRLPIPGPQIEAVTTNGSLATGKKKRAESTRTDTLQSGVKQQDVSEAIKQGQHLPTAETLVKPKADDGANQIVSSSAAPLHKRQVENDGKTPQLTRARLTRKNLEIFTRMTKKKEKETGAASATPSKSAVNSSTTKTTSTTMAGFAAQARKNGVLLPIQSKPPSNIEDIRERLARSRLSASPTETMYKNYVKKVGRASNESTVTYMASKRLLKEHVDEGYTCEFNHALSGFPNEVGFNDGLSTPQPDYVEGLLVEEYDPFPVDDYVPGAVLYKDNPLSLTLPHLAGEWKGPGRNMATASLQSAYDGAALVYARNKALSYMGECDPPNHSEVTTFTADGTNLNLFAHYASASSADGTLKYHQYPIKSIPLTNSHQDFKDGRKWIRNEQDRAKEQSYAMRDRLQEHWKKRGAAAQSYLPLPVVEGDAVEDGAGSADEDGAGYDVAQEPCLPTPVASSNPGRPSKSATAPKSSPHPNDKAAGSRGEKRKSASSHPPPRKSPRHKGK